MGPRTPPGGRILLGSPMHPTGNIRLLDQMVERGTITSAQREAVLNYHQRHGGRVEEALLDVNAVDEAALLKFVAGLYRTRCGPSVLASDGCDMRPSARVQHVAAPLLADRHGDQGGRDGGRVASSLTIACALTARFCCCA